MQAISRKFVFQNAGVGQDLVAINERQIFRNGNLPDGGVVGEHMRWAKIWSDQKYRIIIADDQYSAAAMMVVRLKQNGVRICARKGADLHFHLLDNGIHPAAIVGHRKTIGPLTHRFKRIASEKFGIPRCK